MSIFNCFRLPSFFWVHLFSPSKTPVSKNFSDVVSRAISAVGTLFTRASRSSYPSNSISDHEFKTAWSCSCLLQRLENSISPPSKSPEKSISSLHTKVQTASRKLRNINNRQDLRLAIEALQDALTELSRLDTTSSWMSSPVTFSYPNASTRDIEKIPFPESGRTVALDLINFILKKLGASSDAGASSSLCKNSALSIKAQFQALFKSAKGFSSAK